MINPQYSDLRFERSIIKKDAARSEKGVVTSQHYVAAEAGAKVLASGGNAVDAAVTAAFVLQTVEPWMSGLAGCGYMMIMQPDGQTEVVEFTGRVPSHFDEDYYRPDPVMKTFIGHPASIENRNETGFSSAVIPGCIRGFYEALKKHGTIGFDKALQPAIDQARKGLVVDWHTTLTIAMAQSDLAADEGTNAIFLPNGHAPEPGQILPLTQLSKTLEILADEGPDAFYGGQIGERLIEDLKKGNSFITLDDLADYQAQIYPARRSDIQGKRVYVAGETSAGQRLLDSLKFFDDKHGAGPVGPEMFVILANGLWEAFSAHKKRLNPAEKTNKTSTTHINAVDAHGRMVAITFTLLNRFGARALSPKTGILLNNGMSWFDPTPGRANSLRPNAYAPSNMCPVAIADHSKSFAVLGAAGGNQIVPTLAQLSAFLLHAGLDAEEAMNIPRMSTGPTRDIAVNIDMPADIIAALAAIGTIKPSQQTVFPRPFASPGIVSRNSNLFIGMPDTTYPPAFATVCD